MGSDRGTKSRPDRHNRRREIAGEDPGAIMRHVPKRYSRAASFLLVRAGRGRGEANLAAIEGLAEDNTRKGKINPFAAKSTRWCVLRCCAAAAAE